MLQHVYGLPTITGCWQPSYLYLGASPEQLPKLEKSQVTAIQDVMACCLLLLQSGSAMQPIGNIHGCCWTNKPYNGPSPLPKPQSCMHAATTVTLSWTCFQADCCRPSSTLAPAVDGDGVLSPCSSWQATLYPPLLVLLLRFLPASNAVCYVSRPCTCC